MRKMSSEDINNPINSSYLNPVHRRMQTTFKLDNLGGVVVDFNIDNSQIDLQKVSTTTTFGA